MHSGMIPSIKPPEHTITISPSGKRITVPEDLSLLDAARRSGLDVGAVCGGKGTCGACKVQIISGNYSDPIKQEQLVLGAAALEAGLRLACLTYPRSDGVIHFPPESLGALQRLQLEGVQNEVLPHSALTRLDLDLSIPDISQKESEFGRIREALRINGFLHTDIPEALLNKTAEILQSGNGRISLILNDQELVTVLPFGHPMLGLAVDLGTTKLAAFLVDLQSGATLAAGGALNPQVAYGEDVISRIQYADEHQDGAKELQQCVVRSINDLAADLAEKAGTTSEEIVDCVVVGNTAMHHLLVGLPVHNLGTAPYQPARLDAMLLNARDIGLNLALNASLYLPPNIAGFVGGDHVAMLLAMQARQTL